jgi:hypothetical protein
MKLKYRMPDHSFFGEIVDLKDEAVFVQWHVSSLNKDRKVDWGVHKYSYDAFVEHISTKVFTMNPIHYLRMRHGL